MSQDPKPEEYLYTQLVYIRECRKDPVFRRYELDRQKELRSDLLSKEKRRRYQALYRHLNRKAPAR